MVSLELWYILIKPNNTHIRNCHIYLVQTGNHGLGKIYVTFAESVLEIGNSTFGEHGDVGVVVYPHYTK